MRLLLLHVLFLLTAVFCKFVSNIQILWHMVQCGLVQDWAACTLMVEAAVCSEEPLFTNLHGVVQQKTRI